MSVVVEAADLKQGGSNAVHKIFGFGRGSDAAPGVLAGAGRRGRGSWAGLHWRGAGV